MPKSSSGQIWSTPIPATGESTSCILDDLEADRSGKVWVLYHNTSHYPYDRVFVNYYDGSSWSPSIKTPVENYYMGDLAIDSRNRVWLTWATYTDSVGSIRASCYENGSWSPPQTVTSYKARLNNPMMTVDLIGNMWCAWSRVFGAWHDSCAICVSNRIGDKWLSPTIVEQFLIPEVTVYPSIACDKEGRIWVAWSDFVLVTTYYDGNKWSEPIVIHHAEECFTQSITTDAQGRVWLMWPDLYGTDPNRTYGYYMSHTIGTEWATPIFIPGSRDTSAICFCGDMFGRIWVISYDGDWVGGNIHSKYFEDNVWSPYVRIDSITLNSRFPHALIASDKTGKMLWVAWNEVINNTFHIYLSYTDLTSVGIESPLILSSILRTFHLFKNYPNPFNTQTIITYHLPREQHVSLKVYDVTGRLVTTLVNTDQKPNTYSVRWDGTDEAGRQMASGIYLCQMETKEFRQSIKIILLR